MEIVIFLPSWFLTHMDWCFLILMQHFQNSQDMKFSAFIKEKHFAMLQPCYKMAELSLGSREPYIKFKNDDVQSWLQSSLIWMLLY